MRRISATTVEDFILRRFKRKPRLRGVSQAALSNTTVAQQACDPLPDRENRSIRSGSTQLTTFDCITCDTCPSARMRPIFFIPPIVSFETHDVLTAPDGTWRTAIPPARNQPLQIACYGLATSAAIATCSAPVWRTVHQEGFSAPSNPSAARDGFVREFERAAPECACADRCIARPRSASNTLDIIESVSAT